jgi:hypothetical protein
LTCRQEPEQAVEGISAWVLKEQKEREDQAVRVAERKAKIAEARDKRDAGQLQSSWARFGIPMPLTSAVGQQPLGPIMGLTVIPNPAAIKDGPVVAPVLPQPAHLPVATTDDVTRMTDSKPVTPPQTPSRDEPLWLIVWLLSAPAPLRHEVETNSGCQPSPSLTNASRG